MTHVSAEQAAACLSLAASGYEDRPASAADRLGRAAVSVVEVASRDALRRAKPDAAGFARRLPVRRLRCGLLLYARCARRRKACDLQARMFHPGASGLSEDPATGSATVAAAALLADSSAETGRRTKTADRAGRRHGRPSLLLTRVVRQNGAIASAHVGGGCVQMMEGTFRLAGRGEIALIPSLPGSV